MPDQSQVKRECDGEEAGTVGVSNSHVLFIHVHGSEVGVERVAASAG